MPSASVTPTGGVFTGARVRRTTNQSIPNATLTMVSFDTSDLATPSTMVSIAAHPTRITFITPGVYLVGGIVEFDANVAGGRFADLFLNNTTIVAEIGGGGSVPATGQFPNLAGASIWRFAANDFIEMRIYQSSGGALNITTETWGPQMWATFVGA